MENNEVYVTYTCKNPKCRCAFVDIDPFDTINETPLMTRYCPECVKKGFKNKPFKKKSKDLIAFESFISENNIIDKQDISFLKTYYNKNVKFKRSIGVKFTLRSVFKEGLEVLSYRK